MIKIITGRILGSVLGVLWIVPTCILAVLFLSIPDQLFLSLYCSNYTILQTFKFRSAFTSVIFIPIIIISLNYVYFYYILSCRFKIRTTQGITHHDERVSSGVSKQNRRAAGITLMVLLSCSVCWIPVSVAHLLICPKGCYLSPLDLPAEVNFYLHAISNFLLVAKSLVNPIIFALRQSQIRSALIRILHCINPEVEERRQRQRSVTKNSFIYRSVRNSNK
ncbi:cannabinoid receptor 2 [Eurytemora carolleeae]|uniref:cannabinoid receptor 2 n=1 Tax=Eurytemora carolleeae TaxID=1294199 RepID=UPI000C76D255|nr:cannabinoid receptor 2 [Eurytemora carolleeae]|eukprot:XP_023325111.1 cannabinoid receptor 2-like [Eurytemora affinis]